MAAFAAGLALMLAVALFNFVSGRMTAKTRGTLGGTLIVTFIAYVLIALGYAFWTATPNTSDYLDDTDIEREFTR